MTGKIPGRFLYVFSTQDRDALLEIGLELVRDDNAKSIFVFVNDPDIELTESCGVHYVSTNTLFF